jgi:hypothetical protein
LSRWSCPELAREAVAQNVTESISAATVRRWLARDAIKPWQYRSWIFPRDPDFTVKAERVLDLYERRWNGRKLGPDEYVISSDEKTSIQARCRCHPTLPPGKARMMRVNHEYERGGALAYLAAYDVHQRRRARTPNDTAQAEEVEEVAVDRRHYLRVRDGHGSRRQQQRLNIDDGSFADVNFRCPCHTGRRCTEHPSPGSTRRSEDPVRGRHLPRRHRHR